MDKTQVRTAADLEKKYNFAQMLGFGKNLESTNKQLIKIQNELNSMLNSLIINLGDLLDSQSSISLWFYDGVPTTSNEPYISWLDPTEHYGDFYYDRLSGYVYKFTENGWERQTDINLINAMALTNTELDVEQDHERQVFFDTPEPPYQSGDWWILEDGTLMICQIGKPSGTYEEYDFVNSSRYTETVATMINNTLQVTMGTVAMIMANQDSITASVEQHTTFINNLPNNVAEQLDDLNDNYTALTNSMSAKLDANSLLIQQMQQGISNAATSTDLNTAINSIISYVKYGQESVYNPITETTSTVGVVTIGMTDNPVKLKLANDIFYFEIGDDKVAYIGTDSSGSSKLYITDAKMINQLQIGNFAFVPRSNGSLSFRKVG